MKGHWSRVNLVKRFTRCIRDQCPFISQCKQKSVLQSLNKQHCLNIMVFDGREFETLVRVIGASYLS